MAIAWRCGYHCMVGTYGCWLPGDQRRWCERNHHEDVPKDMARIPRYQKFAQGRLGHSQKLMKYPSFEREDTQRHRIGVLLLEGFRYQKVIVAA